MSVDDLSVDKMLSFQVNKYIMINDMLMYSDVILQIRIK
jgi:hypothetical protein